MIHPIDEARWRELESKAHLPEVQELIRQEIQSRTIGCDRAGAKDYAAFLGFFSLEPS